MSFGKEDNINDDLNINNKNSLNKLIIEKYSWIAEGYGIVGHYKFDIKVPKSENETYNISKRFSEIEWLYNMLLIFGAGCIIPKLPEKHIWTNFVSHSNSLIDERKKQISEFLNAIYCHKNLSKTACFQDFLNVKPDINYGLNEKKGLLNSAKSVFNYLGYGSNNNNSSNNKYPSNYFSKKLYEEEDKFNIQRLCQGTKDVLKGYKDQYNILKERNDSIKQISDLASKMNSFYSPSNNKDLKYLNNNNNNNNDNNNSEQTKRIFETNNNYMTSVYDCHNKHLDIMKKDIKHLEVIYYNM